MKEGDIAPNFVLKDQTGKEFELYKNLDKQILLVFYPKDDTPVCSAQLSDYSFHLNDFEQAGIEVVGINSDSLQSHNDFCSKLKLNIPLLIDEDKLVGEKFDAVNIFGMTKRKLILIGTDKSIRWMHSTLPITYLKPRDILEKVGTFNSKEMT